MKLKHKFLILLSIVIFIYVSGFISGRLIKPFRYNDITKTEKIISNIDLKSQYKIQSQAYIDSANSEMLNYSMKYYNLRPDLLPDTYTSIDNKVKFNKENFFRYYSLYKITDYLSKSKSAIIKDLLIEVKKDTATLKPF